MIPALLDIIRKVIAIIIALLLYLLPKAMAQVDTVYTPLTDSSRIESTDTPVPVGTLMQRSPAQASGFTMTKSPWQALWRSFVLPGFGQYYNEDYWKVPLFVGATGYFVYNIIDNQNKFLEKRDAVISAEQAQSTAVLALKVEREFYRDKRDQAAFYLLGVYVVSIIDAYVGTHLYDFDVGDEMTFTLQPSIHSIGIRVQW